jgi:regulator of RNase E activity RraA
MKRGCAGVVTDGGFRDSAEIAKLGFRPITIGRARRPILTLHQAIEINVPIWLRRCAGVSRRRHPRR